MTPDITTPDTTTIDARPPRRLPPHLMLVGSEPPTPGTTVRLTGRPQSVQPDAAILVQAIDAETGAYLWTAAIGRMADWLARHGLAFDRASNLWRRATPTAPEAA